MDEITFLGPINFLRTILWLVVFYYAAKFLFKWWLKRKISAHAEALKNSVSEQEANAQREQEGRVSIKKNSSKDQSSDQGEYVDYEEVK